MLYQCALVKSHWTLIAVIGPEQCNLKDVKFYFGKAKKKQQQRNKKSQKKRIILKEKKRKRTHNEARGSPWPVVSSLVRPLPVSR
ncbi:hypothetical protein ElyMa_000706400 [Elysia marginata]|uniref:Uncharacterized protein n=1 Tax=Elysia marginata TaxID=1093978 RepID=A0AAV4GKQ5_9GAST|nr:hypothetical protein ElyMa_000706400 [Elysia marginata]